MTHFRTLKTTIGEHHLFLMGALTKFIIRRTDQMIHF